MYVHKGNIKHNSMYNEIYCRNLVLIIRSLILHLAIVPKIFDADKSHDQTRDFCQNYIFVQSIDET